mgnify:CR=1 FL=1
MVVGKCRLGKRVGEGHEASVQPRNPFAGLGATSLPRREFAVVFASLLTVAAGNTALQTVLPAIARVIHLPDMLVAVIFSFSALLWTVSAPYWARQSDIRGRRRLMLVGSLGFMVSMTGCGIAIYAGLNGWLAPIATFALFASLRSLFGLPPSVGARESLVVVQFGSNRAGVVVDQLVGELQAVIKPLGQIFAQNKVLSGSTILGDGSVALILDVAHLIQRASAAAENSVSTNLQRVDGSAAVVRTL